MRKKIIELFLLMSTVSAASFIISVKVGVAVTLFAALFLILILVFILLNILIKRTNWWKNQFNGITQFVSNTGYRDNIIRNYDIVNLGSNSAHFAFFYEGVKGQSWSTGSQGQDMDFEILKYYHSYLKDGGTVLIPIMPFSAISPYLKNHSEYWGVPYYSKFYRILEVTQTAKLPYNNTVRKYLRFPALVNWHALVSLVIDSEPDKRLIIEEQPMMTLELQQDASNWIKMWKQEFKLNNLEDVLSGNWLSYYEESVGIYKQMIEFCLERHLKPVFICIPMTKHLSNLFPQSFWDYMIREFILRINDSVPFLDYTNDVKFQDDNLYMNSYFLNMRGRKLFTKQVLQDLGLR